ncbi:MAG: VanW family protein [Eubacteriales bacterium]
MKPKKRTLLRIKLGKIYYTIKRYIKWYFGKQDFANEINDKLLPFIISEHKTPLFRKLKDVDMWLQYNKIKNLEVALKALNRVVLYPEQTFSYWKLIGKPMRRRGYVDGMVLFYGKYGLGVGGGLCQLSNLIYWVTLHTNLTVIERHRHSYDVFPDSNRNQPFGSGATCSFNYLDLQIKNNTAQAYQLHLFLTKEYLVGEWRSVEKSENNYEVYEKEHWISHEYWGGYIRHNKIHRYVYDKEQKMIDDEYITENHAIMMYQPFLTEDT